MTKLSSEAVVAVVGLGYVGLPLTVEFDKKFRTIGYDLSKQRLPPTASTSIPPEKSP